MAKPKTSAEKAREEEENSQLNSMLGDAFGDIGSLEPVTEASAPVEPDPTPSPTGPPTGPPSGPPKGPPSGPPTGPPSGPPSGPPAPSGPASSEAVIPVEAPMPADTGDAPSSAVETSEGASEEPVSAAPTPVETLAEPSSPATASAPQAMPDITPSVPQAPPEGAEEPVQADVLLASTPAQPIVDEVEAADPSAADEATAALLAEKEAELERLHMENARLRQSVVGATEVIEALEEPPMPPMVDDTIVIAPHIVSDFVRIGRQLDREHLVRATMGSVAMLHPEQPGLMISSRHMVTLPRMTERSLCAGPLGGGAPRGAPSDWHVLEVVLASVSMVTGGPAAVIHMHGPHTTAASCEKDLVLLNPIDELGKHHIGKIIIVDPDPEHPEDFLRHVAEALQQGGMRCVVVRGNGAYAVGADFDQAWANAAMLEHSMHIHLLARQANLKL